MRRIKSLSAHLYCLERSALPWQPLKETCFLDQCSFTSRVSNVWSCTCYPSALFYRPILMHFCCIYECRWYWFSTSSFWSICVWTLVFLPEWLRGSAFVCGRRARALTACQHWLIAGYMWLRQHFWYHSANRFYRHKCKDYRQISFALILPNKHFDSLPLMHSNEPSVEKQPFDLGA